MVKNHLKRLAMPRRWKLHRKKTYWITRPLPGAHDHERSVSLETVMKEFIKCANTRREAKNILQRKEVLVDGKKRKELKMPVGLMDVVSIPETGEHHRIILGEKGEIKSTPIKKEESGLKPCKITGKTMIRKGIVQLNLFDSKNITLKDDDKRAYSTGDTLLLSLPGLEIKDHFKLEKGAYVYLTGGAHTGKKGRVEEIKEGSIKLKSEDGKSIETAKEYSFVIGNDKASIQI